MKIDRLLGILVLLSKNDKITAPKLAERFEVSVRTINRDIETLCMAGIPIVTKQGSGGGIYIQKGYKIDKTIFKENELSEIISGLRALDSINYTQNTLLLLNKILPTDEDEHKDIIKIELGSFYKDSISSKISIIKEAVSLKKCVSFTYYSKRGESIKTVEPYYIIFKWDNWYLYGFSDDFRLYKLNRLWDLKITDNEFMPKDTQDKTDKLDEIFTSNYHLKALFDKSTEYKLVEEYGDKSYHITDDNKLLFQRDFTNYDYMLNWVLGFGGKVEVIEPKELREDIKNIALSIYEMYNRC